MILDSSAKLWKHIITRFRKPQPYSFIRHQLIGIAFDSKDPITITATCIRDSSRFVETALFWTCQSLRGPSLSIEKRFIECEYHHQLSMMSSKGNQSSNSPNHSLDTEEVLEAIGTALFAAAQKANSQEKKLSVLLGGYMARQKTLSSKFSEANSAYVQSSIQKHIFEGTGVEGDKEE
ncbi:hypothetical protein V1525DRAFT_129438 [Lipomyces kononenkoae]|uniref:Uncharacterized protein n=1 Tax=Lipomyces kononenkoae TaxID=34357 RepID=A0ACC3T220_LIPKO